MVFTRLMDERNQHLIKYRANTQGYKDHTAKDTMDFLERAFVQTSEDSHHIAWTNVLLHTRENSVKLFDWLRSIGPLVRKLIESQSKRTRLTKAKKRRINVLLFKQVTDNEQIQISLLENSYDQSKLISGHFLLGNLLSIIAKNIEKFSQRPFHQTAPIKDYLSVRYGRHLVCKPVVTKPHLVQGKKRKRNDQYNFDAEEYVEKGL